MQFYKLSKDTVELTTYFHVAGAERTRLCRIFTSNFMGWQVNVETLLDYKEKKENNTP
jgi:hypothetical protein